MSRDLHTRRESIDRREYASAVRDAMNASVSGTGHQAIEYHPSAFRHFVRRIALLGALAELDFDTALDVGCAEGFFGAAIRDRFGTEVWDVDISQVAVETAHERYGFPAGAADATRLPFRDDSFDLVYSTEVIEHVLDPADMVAEISRVARKWIVVTTPVSQTEHDETPDYELAHEGHVNNFDTGAVRRLFGPTANLGSFRCNATFAAIVAFARYLPRRPRDWFYELDYRTSQRLGAPHKRFKPLRNRDWLITLPATGAAGASPQWACPLCHGDLNAEQGGLRCERDAVLYPFVVPAVPDFFSPISE